MLLAALSSDESPHAGGDSIDLALFMLVHHGPEDGEVGGQEDDNEIAQEVGQVRERVESDHDGRSALGVGEGHNLAEAVEGAVDEVEELSCSTSLRPLR